MRILAVTNMYPSPARPGSGVFVAEQVRALREMGVEVQVEFIDRRTEGPWVYYRAADRVRRAVDRFRPSVIHMMYGGVLADQITRGAHLRPIVLTFHGSDLLGENHSGFWRRMVSSYGVLCSRRAARRAQAVIIVARHLESALGGCVPAERLHVIPCGIDLERFRSVDRPEAQRRLGWAPELFHVLFASSNGDPVKRPDLARAAVEQLRREGIPAEFHFMSGIPNVEVPAWLSASDALLLTSAHEGSPTIVKEALVAGLPVVSVDVGDVAERIMGVEGCYLAQPSPDDLAHQLTRVWQRHARLAYRPQFDELSSTHAAHRLAAVYRQFGELPFAESPAVPSRNAQAADAA